MFDFLKTKDKSTTQPKEQSQESFNPKELNDKLDEKKIIVELQPQISVSDRRCVGAEALSRYVDDNNNMIGPMMFLPILESASVVSELDYAVVKQIAITIKEWMNNDKRVVPVAINFSRVDFTERGFLEKVDSRFENIGIDKSHIVIDVRESAIADNYEFMYKRLHWLSEKGYKIAVDDFGRENNIFFKLGDLPIDIIKFDRAVLSDALHGAKGKKLIGSMIEGFKESGYQVICEGVETDEQKDEMSDLGIEVIQGFLYDRPMKINEFEEKYIR